MSNVIEIADRKTDADLIQLLETSLARAKAGELQMGVVVLVGRGSPGVISYGIAGAGDKADVVFMLERAKLELVMPGDGDEEWSPGRLL